MLATMFLNQPDTNQRLQGSFVGSFFPSLGRKSLLTVLSCLMLVLLGSYSVSAQVLQAKALPESICEGNTPIIVITPPVGLPSGVTVSKYVVYIEDPSRPGDSIETPINNLNIPINPPYAPGIYHPYVVARLSNGTRLSSSKLNVTVYSKPVANLVNLTQDVQCFKGNNVCFQNLSVPGPAPSAPIVDYVWGYGDAFSDSLKSPVDVCHSYSFPGTFIVNIKVIDSVGCSNEYFLNTSTPIIIKPALTPVFNWIARSGPCYISNYLFTNSTPVSIDALTSYRWEFGDDSIYEAFAPFTPEERAFFDTIGHDYTINGEFTPFISVKDTTGCIDSIRYTNNNSPVAIPKNIVFEFDMVTVASPTDASARDSVCIGSGNAGSICFKQTPIQFAGPGDYLWVFDDPASQQENFNFTSWEPCHQFVGGLGTYYVTLSISNVCPGKTITHTYTAGRTFWDNKYIDKYIYTGNDTVDVESAPLLMRDTVNFSKYKKPLWSLVYLNEFNVSEGDTLYAYKRVDVERPIFYLGDSLAINKANSTIKDSIVLQPNWTSIVPIPNTTPQKYDTFAGYASYGYGARVIGPFSRIEKTSPPPVLIASQQKNQCGPNDTVEFVNTSLYYKSRKMYRRWDFDDNFAPQCTSFSVPKFGFPPIISTSLADSITFDNGKTYKQFPNDTIRMWANSEQQFKNSDYYFIANGNTYEGKMNCKFSYDTLPWHIYPNWDTVARWYNFGKDFMPWDPAQYGSGPGQRPVHPGDTMYWNKPVYLNPSTGEWSLTQGSGPAPFGTWVRIDTMNLRYNNGQDLNVGEPITIRNLPDPFRSGLVDDKGKYNIIPSGSVEPTNTISYFDKTRNATYFINGSDILPNSSMSFYKYAFMRTIVRCITVRLKLQDSLNNETTKGITLDETKLDIADCNMESTAQLSFARADAHGLGKSGKECPGRNPDGLINFELAGFGDFPGTKPECGQTFILMNFDSLADRLDNTPCSLDGFVSFAGGTTAGGLNIPPYFTAPNFNPPSQWPSPSQTRIAYHYGLNAPANRPPPADTAQGFISIGVIIGSGCRDTTISHVPLDIYNQQIAYYGDATTAGGIVDPTNPVNINIPVNYNSSNVPVPGANTNYDYKFSQLKNYRVEFALGVPTTYVDIEYTDCAWPKCLSDTVWYHKFIRIQNLTSRFETFPINCRLRHVGDEVTVHYEDSVQDNIKYSVWLWGDKTITVDSFYYAPGGANLTDGYFTNGYRRVRYNFDNISGVPQLLDSTVWPVRSPGIGIQGLKPRVLADSVLAKNLYQIYNVLDRTSVPDSMIVQNRCYGNIDTLANKDTMQFFPLSQIIDTALMFLPVKHKFIRSSWDAAGRGPDANIGSLIHFIVSYNDCSQGSARPMVIGIIDTFAINNVDGNRDTLFCQNEAVYFVDSIRYWRGDCSVTSLPLNPALSLSPQFSGFLSASPFNSYQFDSADFWRQDYGDPRVIQDTIRTPPFVKWNAIKGRFEIMTVLDTVVPEKVYWDFGDGSPIDSSLRPVHRYQTFGRFTVKMVTKDSLRGFDTCIGYVNVSVPVAKIGFTLDGSGLPRDVFNCGDFADLIDSSAMDPSTVAGSLDSVKTNYWWFGENKIDTVMWQTKNNFFPKWPYRNNGLFRIKLVSESYLGCKDTTYDTVFVRGPRPAFKILIDGDTIGCAPFTVKIWNMADSLGKQLDANGVPVPTDTPTLTTYFDWGDGVSPQTIVFGRRDTVEFTYTKAGDYDIYAYGSDAPPGGQNSCELVTFPDTTNRSKITIHVKELKRNITTDKDVVCIQGSDPTAVSSPVRITNSSDPAFYQDYKYFIQRRVDSTTVDSTLRTALLPDSFNQTFPDTGICQWFTSRTADPEKLSGS
jgi:hypothetical protein